MELAYALPPRSTDYDGRLSALKRYADDLNSGVTDSGAGGFKWSYPPQKVMPKPPQAPQFPMSPRRQPPRPESDGWRPRSRTGRSSSSGAKFNATASGPIVMRPSKLPSLRAYGPGGEDPSPVRPLEDPRALSCSVPRAYHRSIDMSPAPPPPARARSPSRDIVAGASGASPRPGQRAAAARSSSPPLARTAVVPSWQHAVEGAHRSVPRPPPVPKQKSLEDYISKACVELLSAPGSSPLTWCTADSEADYRKLLPGQFFNHFQNNKELTTKTGLAQNLAQYTVSSGINVDRYFPRCYDVSQRSDREDFILDFRRSAALKVALLHLKLSASAHGDTEQRSCADYRFSNKVVSGASKTLQRWCCELDPEHMDDEGVVEAPPVIDDRTWDALVLYSELTEAQLCRQKEDCDPTASHPRRRYHRIGGGDIPEDARATSSTATVKRPPDVQQWDEFNGHHWLSPHEFDSSQLEAIVLRLEKIFPQFDLQGGWVGRNVWIIKPGTCSKGSGVECMNTLPEMLHHCEQMPNRLVQKYIERPLLLFSGRKFDIRQWVLVRSVSPLRIFMFSECYLRLCNGMYDLGDLRDRERHISNWQVNKNGRHGNVVEGACAPLADFRSELCEITGKGNFWEEALLPQLQDIVVNTMRSVDGKLTQRADSFEVFGFDLMVDEAMRMWLLEVNLSPGCEGRMPFLEGMLGRMSKRLIEIAVLGKEEPDGILPDWVNICDDAGRSAAAGASRDRQGACDLTVRGQPMRTPVPPLRPPPANRPPPRVAKTLVASSAGIDAVDRSSEIANAEKVVEVLDAAKPKSFTPSTAASDDADCFESEVDDVPASRNLAEPGAATLAPIMDVEDGVDANYVGGIQVGSADAAEVGDAAADVVEALGRQRSGDDYGFESEFEADDVGARALPVLRQESNDEFEPDVLRQDSNDEFEPDVLRQKSNDDFELDDDARDIVDEPKASHDKPLDDMTQISKAPASLQDLMQGASRELDKSRELVGNDVSDDALIDDGSQLNSAHTLPASTEPSQSFHASQSLQANDEVVVSDGAEQPSQQLAEEPSQQFEDDFDDEEPSQQFSKAADFEQDSDDEDLARSSSLHSQEKTGAALAGGPSDQFEDEFEEGSDYEDLTKSSEEAASRGLPAEPSQQFEDDFEYASADEDESPARKSQQQSQSLKDDPSQLFEDDFEAASGEEASDFEADEVVQAQDPDDDFELESSPDEEDSR